MALVEKYFKYAKRGVEEEEVDEKSKRNPIYLAICECLSDSNSYWYSLRGIPHVVAKIWNLMVKCWKATILFADDKLDEYDYKKSKQFYLNYGDYVDYGDSDDYDNIIRFPESKDIFINMMPFILAWKFDDTKLPDYLEGYFKMFISKCLHKVDTRAELGKVCYLSVQEGTVDGNKPQRRPGLHTECPGSVAIRNTDIDAKKGKGLSEVFYSMNWGRGEYYPLTVKGGIFMSSNISDSCMVWNCQVPPDSSGNEIIGKLGDMEYLRDFLPEGKSVQANALYWITDRTPHESLPVPDGTYRQWCRLVTSQVSLWFYDHSTVNPNGVTPDPRITKIVKGSKFDEDTLTIIPNLDSAVLDKPSANSFEPIILESAGSEESDNSITITHF